MIGTSGGILSRAGIISRVSSSNRIDGQERNTGVDTNSRDTHLGRKFLAVKGPAEIDGKIALRYGALDCHRLPGSDGLVA